MKYLLFIFLFFSAIRINGQCKIENNFFRPGEEIRYDVYFKYGLIDAKAGHSTLAVSDEKYDNTDVLKLLLIGNTKGLAGKLFSLSDTLISYVTHEVIPLAYIKNAHESGDHTIEKALYSYKNDKVTVKTDRVRNGVLRFDEELTSDLCLYDMLSIIFYARTIDFSTMMKGDKKTVATLSGKKIVTMDIEDHGTETIKANDGKKYDCIKLVLVINTDAFENKKEAMKVYITNDYNRIPVWIESKLKIGSTRAVLKNVKGNLHPLKTN